MNTEPVPSMLLTETEPQPATFSNETIRCYIANQKTTRQAEAQASLRWGGGKMSTDFRAGTQARPFVSGDELRLRTATRDGWIDLDITRRSGRHGGPDIIGEPWQANWRR